jgi:hypothetical protein
MRTRRFSAEQIIGIVAEQIIGNLKEHPQNL